MNPEALYLAQLPTIDRIAAFVARRNRLTYAETEEFLSLVRMNLFEDDYAILRKFEGRSSLSTYLTTVIQRMCIQYRVQMWGRWRPSAEAKRLGDKAITLERLITRDGYTFEEAAQILMVPQHSPYTRAELEALYVRLPNRGARVTFENVSLEGVDEESAEQDEPSERKRGPSVDDVLIHIPDEIGRDERVGRAEKIGRALADVTSNLDPEDRLIVHLRFFDGLKVPEIARKLGIDQKKLYKRIDKIFTIFRRELEKQQINSEDIAELIARDDAEPEVADPNVRTIKSADLLGIYVDRATARRTLEELLDDPKKASGRK